MDPIVRELMSNYLPLAKNYQLDITSKKFPKNTTPYIFTAYSKSCSKSCSKSDDFYNVKFYPETGDYTRQICFRDLNTYADLISGSEIYKYVLLPKIPTSEFIRRYYNSKLDNGLLSLYLPLSTVNINYVEDIDKNRELFDYNIMHERKTICQYPDYIIYSFKLDNYAIYQRFRITTDEFLKIRRNKLYTNATYFIFHNPERFLMTMALDDDRQFAMANAINFACPKPLPTDRELSRYITPNNKDIIIYRLHFIQTLYFDDSYLYDTDNYYDSDDY